MKAPALQAIAITGFFITLSAFSQGSLTPPGAPAPTMRTLNQIEPRIPISFLPTNILTSGSYYVTTNLTGTPSFDGIEISANNVTLDLSGFTLTGVASSQNGIRVSGTYTNIIVRNGTVVNWGFSGVDAFYSGSPRNMLFENITASGNGISGVANGSGITTEAASIIKDCLACNNPQGGIYCNGGLVTGCIARGNSGTGIAGVNCNIRDCTVDSTTGDGIQIATSGTVSGCYVTQSTLGGIYVSASGALVSGNNLSHNNTSSSATRAGIYISGSNNRIENNQLTFSGNAGIDIASGTVNVVIRNSAFGNGANNYVSVANNDVAAITTAALATNAFSNISH